MTKKYMEYDRIVSRDSVRKTRTEMDAGSLLTADLRGYGVLPAKRQLEMIAHAQAGDTEARDLLVLHSMGLVFKIASRFALVYHTRTEDAVQDGVIGLMKAIEKFDRRVHTRFSTYATFWIECYVRRSVVAENQTIHIPERTYLEWLRARKQAIANNQEPPPPVVETIPLSSRHQDSDRELGDIIPDEGEQERARNAVTGQLVTDLIELADLTAREYRVITLRFGLEDGQSRTLEEVAALMPHEVWNTKRRSITRERVRQLETRAMAKLRAAAVRLKSLEAA